MGQARQTVERRQLGLALKRLREDAGRSQQEAADAIRKVRSRVVQLESGTGTVRPDDLVKLLDFYKVGGSERETALALGAETRKRQKRRTYTDLLPGSFQRLADLEADAEAIFCYEVGVIPGLLQCSAYVSAIMQTGQGVFWGHSEQEVDSRTAFRLDRQSRVLGSEKPKDLQFVFTEDCITVIDQVMREQLEHLISLVDLHPNITIQVLQVGGLGNPAPNGGIEVLDFRGSAPRVGFAPVIFGPSTYFHEEADTSVLVRVFKKVQALALSPDRSMTLIRKNLENS